MDKTYNVKICFSLNWKMVIESDNTDKHGRLLSSWTKPGFGEKYALFTNFFRVWNTCNTVYFKSWYTQCACAEYET